MRTIGSRLGLGMAVLFCLIAFSGSAEACGTACQLTAAPECMGCRYTFFTRTICIRVNCERCDEDFCWVGKPSSIERLAFQSPQDGQACTAPFSDSPEYQEPTGPKIIKVDVMNARS